MGGGAVLRGSAGTCVWFSCLGSLPPGHRAPQLCAPPPPPHLAWVSLISPCRPIWLSPSSPSLSTFIFPSPLHTCTRACPPPPPPPPPLGCGINTVVADSLPLACGGRGHTAHAQPARWRDAVIGTCQTAAAHFRKSTGALLVLLLAGAAHPSFWKLLGLHATPARAQLSPQDSPHSSSAPGATPLQGVVPAPCPPPPPQVELRPSPWCQRNVMQGVGGAKLQGVLSKQGVLSLQREGVLRPPP